MLWAASTAKAQSVLWIVPPWNLRADRFQKLDPKQKRCHSAQYAHRKIQVQHDMTGWKKSKKIKWKEKKKSCKQKTETHLLELWDNPEEAWAWGSPVFSAESSAQQCLAVPWEKQSFHGMGGTWDNKPAAKRGFAQSLLGMGISISPSETHLMLTKVDQN